MPAVFTILSRDHSGMNKLEMKAGDRYPKKGNKAEEAVPGRTNLL